MTQIDTELFGLSEVTGELLDGLYPGQFEAEPVPPDPDELMLFTAAVATCLDGWWDVLGEQWDTVLDAENTPVQALDYAAQFGGVVYGGTATEAEKRHTLTDPPAFGRGTPAAILAAGRPTLTGTQGISMIERPDDEAYQLYIRTLVGETPDEDVTRAAFEAAVPGGIILDYAAFDGPTFSDIDAEYASFGAVESAYDSFEEMRTDNTLV